VEIPNWGVDRETGLIPGVTCLCSPHCDDRPADCAIDAVVVHAITLPPGEFRTDAIQDLFLGCLDITAHPYYSTIKSSKVSAHFLIDRAGKLAQFVPVTRRAWHAGVSSLKDRDRVNDFSVGIELVGSDDTAFEAPQYVALAYLIRALQSAYPSISNERIVGHSEIAPGRKTDPGPRFDWSHLRQLMAKFSVEEI